MTEYDALIVPVKLHALVVYSAGKGGPFEVQSLDFGALPLLDSPEPAPFSGGLNGRPPGVYLHWRLPNALTHGVSGANGPVYPYLPNRWIVQRVGAGGTRCWVVESDYLGADGSSAFVNTDLSSRSGQYWNGQIATGLGRKRALAGWTEPAAGAAPFLTALGPGDLAFTAYQPNVLDVLSIYDDMTDEQGQALSGGSGGFSYYVAGWYANTQGDPLNPGGSLAAGLGACAAPGEPCFAALLQQLNWQVAGGATAGWAGRSLYQGALSGVDWEPESGTPPSSRRPGDDARITVAIGNTSTDALGALLRQQEGPGSLKPELLEAFQKQMIASLDETDGAVLIQAAVEQSWFGRHPGDIRWIIAATGQADPADVKAVSLTPGQQQWLASLNNNQQALDQVKRGLSDLQRQLYELWWKQQRAQVVEQDTGIHPIDCHDYQFTDAMAKLAYQVSQAINQVKALAAKVPTGATYDTWRAAIASCQSASDSPLHGTDLVLKAVPSGQFHEAVDPVVMISGAGNTQTIDTATLSCRFSSDPASITVRCQGGARRIGPEDVVRNFAGQCGSADWPADVPREVPGLLQELYVLDAANAEGLACAVFGPDSRLAADIRLAQRRSLTTTEVAASVQTWEQPWQPLYLEWELHYYPFNALPPDVDSAQGADGPWSYAANLGNWQFDGSDYQWSGGLLPDSTPAEIQPVALSGRSLLMPQSQFLLQRRLQEYIDAKRPDYATLESLQDAIEQLDGWDLLSQRLGGLSEQLLCQDIGMHLQPSEPYASLIKDSGGYGDAPQYNTPMPGSPKSKTWQGYPTAPFQQFRAGQFYVRRMNLLDRFGQVLNLVTSDASSTHPYKSFRPVLADPVAPREGNALSDRYPTLLDNVDPACFIELRPRLLQPARLDFDLVDASDASQVVGIDTAANPVGGWVLPDHLGHGLALYAPDGQALGELVLFETEQEDRRLGWRPYPNGPYPTLARMQTELPVLYGFANGLLGQDAKTFQAVLASIDDSLWTCEPQGWRDDRLSLLIGRPLALVTARLGLSRLGDPPRDPSWAYTFAGADGAPTTPPDRVGGYAFAVRLGNSSVYQEGTIGYFRAPSAGAAYDFGTFYDVQDQAAGRYLSPISGNYPMLEPDGDKLGLCLLVDPRGDIQATTGILPIHSLRIPGRFTKTALHEMRVAFAAGPILTPAPDDTSAQVQMPVPALNRHKRTKLPDNSGQQADASAGDAAQTATPVTSVQWTWLENTAQGWRSRTLAHASTRANLPAPKLTLREGMLQLDEQEESE